jgi:hypothetical protein
MLKPGASVVLPSDGYLKSFAARRWRLPILQAMRELQRHGVELSRVRALDVFAGDGKLLTSRYAPLVRSVEAWEAKPELRPVLEQNLPNATVKIVDSFEAIKLAASGSFDLIVVDNYQDADENFDLFPALWDVLSDDAALVINVIPRYSWLTRRIRPSLFDQEHLANRRAFGLGQDGSTMISKRQLADVYCRKAAEAGLTTEWYRFVRRTERFGPLPVPVSFYLLVMKLKRVTRGENA